LVAGRRENRLGAAPRDAEPGLRLRVRYRRQRRPGQSTLLQRRHLHCHLGRPKRRPRRGQAYVSKFCNLPHLNLCYDTKTKRF
jgi:hypothetical protein